MLHILFEFLECCVGVQLKKNAKIEHRVRAGFGAGEGAREWGWERQKNRHGRMQLHSSDYIGRFHWVSLCRNAWVCGDIMGRLKREYDTK